MATSSACRDWFAMFIKRCSSTSIEAIDQSQKSRATTALNLKRRKSEWRGSFSITLKSELTLTAEPSSTWRNQPEWEISTPVMPRVGFLRRHVDISVSYSVPFMSERLRYTNWMSCWSRACMESVKEEVISQTFNLKSKHQITQQRSS